VRELRVLEPHILNHSAKGLPANNLYNLLLAQLAQYAMTLDAGCQSHRQDSAEVSDLATGDGRTPAATMGGRRGPGVWLGGVSLAALATGLSRPTITAGLHDLKRPAQERATEATRVRRPGGGRRPLTEIDRGLLVALEALIEPTGGAILSLPCGGLVRARGGLAQELTTQKHPVGPSTVPRCCVGRVTACKLIARRGKAPRIRTVTPQFEYINALRPAIPKTRPASISVDTKKKELIGDFRNGGREWPTPGRA